MKEIRWSKIFIYLILIIFLLVSLGPLYLVWTAAFKDRPELAVNLFGIPKVFHWENIGKAWEQGHFGIYYRNSVLVVIPVVLISLLLCLGNAYAFAYFRLPFKELLFGVILFGMTIPMEVVIIQLYYHLLDLKLLNTRMGLILPQIGLSIPFGTFFLRGSLKDIPRTLIEAAEMDGAGPFLILRRVITPLAIPSLIALTIFFFTWTWNEFLMALVVVSKETLRTLPVGMAFFQGKYTGNIPLIAMGTTLMTLPVVALYVMLQRWVISGITAGALKE